MADNKKIGIEFETRYKGGGSTQFKRALANIEQQLKEVENQNKKFAETLVQTDKKIFKLIDTNKKLADSMDKIKAPTEAIDGIKKLKGSFLNLTNAVKGFLALEVTKRIISIGKACLTASSDMTELQNVTDQVFGDMAKEVEQFAEDIGNAMGRSTYALQKYTSDIGSIFKGLGGIADEDIKKMSEDLAALAVDIGSFKNIADDRVFTAITAGIVGETEPLKRLGIVINETTMAEYALTKGIKENWESLNQATKAQLRYQKIMESTSFMQGDAARTINTYANQLKVFEANIKELTKALGDKFVNSANGVLQVINKVTDGLTKFFNRKDSSDFINTAMQEITNVKSLLYEYKALSEVHNQNTKDRQRMKAIVDELKATYPSEMGQINTLTTDYNELSKAIDNVTNSIQKKMEMATRDYFNTKRLDLQKKMMEDNEKVARAMQKNIEYITNSINIAGKEFGVTFNADDFVAKVQQGTVKSLEEYIRKTIDSKKIADQLLDKLKNSSDIHEWAEIGRSTRQIAKGFEYFKTSENKLLQVLKELDSSEKLMFNTNQQGLKAIKNSVDTQQMLYQKEKVELKKRFDEAQIDRAIKNHDTVYKIYDAKSKTVDAVIGNNIGLSSKETLEILKNRGVIEMFVGGVKQTFKQLEDGRIEQSTTNTQNKLGYTVNSRGQYVKDSKTTIITEKDFFKQLQDNFKKDVPKTPKIGVNPSKVGGGGSSKGGANAKHEKEKNKWEQMLENLDKTLNDLTTPLNNKLAPKLKILSNEIRKKQDELTEWLVSVSEIKGFEGTKEKIKHLEEQLKVAVDIKDGNSVERIREEINKLKVENVLPELFGNINKELEEKIRQAQGMNKNANQEDIDITRANIEKYKAEKMAYYKSQLENGNLSQSEYIDKQLELHKEIIGIYKKYSDKASEIKAFIEQKQLEVQQVADNIQQGVFIANIENAINNGSTEQLRDGIVKVYDEALSKIQQAIIESAKNLDTKEYSEAQKLLTSKGEEFNKIAKKISEKGSEQLKALLELVKNLFNLKEVRNEKNALTNSEKALKSLEIVGNTIKTISNSLGGSVGELLNSVSKTIDTTISIFNNVQKAIQSKANGDLFGMFDSIGKIIGSVVGVIGGIFQSLLGDDNSKKVNLEYEKAQNKWNDELFKVNNALIDALYNLSGDMKKFNDTLIKNIASDTSNINIYRNQKIAEQMAQLYLNAFNPTVKTQIQRKAWVDTPWYQLGTTDHWEYGGIETEERALKKILGITEFKSTDQIREIYNQWKDKQYRGNFQKRGHEGHWAGTEKWWQEDFIGSNFGEVLEAMKNFADTVDRNSKQAKNTARFGIMQSMEGLEVTSANQLKEQAQAQMKKLIEASGQDYSKVASKIEQKLNEIIKDDEVIVTAFNDTRNAIHQKLVQGNSVISSLGEGLQSYFNKIRTNLAKVKYDFEFRDLESGFNKKFRELSEELTKMRLNKQKALDPKFLDFSNLFKQMKQMEKVSNELKDVVKKLREQAKAQGISDEIIDQMLPLDKIGEKVKAISEMLKNALMVAIDTNSFEQFSMTLGDSLYKHIKESVIKAFVETTKFQELYKRYMNTEEYDKEIQKANTMRQAFDLIKKQLDRAENMLKAEGLGFRETNASTGEYKGGLMARQPQVEPSRLIGVSGASFNTTVNIYNSGYLATDSNKFVQDMTDQIIKKLDERKKKEV